MNAEQFESMIQFKSVEVGKGIVLLTATVEAHACCHYDKLEIERPRDIDALARIKKDLTETLMRLVYEDQRQLFYDALMDLFKASPMDYTEMSAARERLLRAAKRQQR